MWTQKLLKWSFAILILVDAAYLSPKNKGLHEEDCFCKLKGVINDCPCRVETVDQHNNLEIYPLLRSLIQNDYFRYFRVNLQRKCPFWPDDSKCALRDCHVNTCTEDELPHELKGEAAHARAKRMARLSSISAPNLSPDSRKKCSYRKDGQNQHGDGNHGDANHGYDCGDGNLGDLDKTISAEKSKAFANWTKYDDSLENFCELDDESSSELEYVDLLLNPERYTGYKGSSAHRIWSSIYNENCFKPLQTQSPYGPSRTSEGDIRTTLGLCLEKRVFYRMISGMHSSINLHLTHQYLLKESPFGPSQWGPNVKMFQERFSEGRTNGDGPQRLKNLYFLYLVMMRALVKAAPYLEREVFFTGNSKKDKEVRDGVKQVLNRLKTFPNQFDESRLFRGESSTAKNLKEEFRSHFRNISRIMDCVGCDKCKLWGKVQTQGIGTALKILFSGSSMGPESTLHPRQKYDFQLRRSEISSLFNAFARFSSSINSIEDFRQIFTS